jgi:hypothetical protein
MKNLVALRSAHASPNQIFCGFFQLNIRHSLEVGIVGD